MHLHLLHRVLPGLPLLLLLLLPMASLSRPTIALGINCRGSWICGSLDNRRYVSPSEALSARASTNPASTRTTNTWCGSIGKNSEGVCAFLQGTSAGLKGSEIVPLIAYLAAHDCENCGSVPIGHPQSDDPSDGILTVNIVDDTDNPRPDGICFTCNPADWCGYG